MIDGDLLASLVLIAAALGVVIAVAPPRTGDRASLFDVALWPVMAGVLAGRVTAAALDDPHALSRPGDLLVLRGGVEFWAGVATAAAVGVWSARRARQSAVARLADVAPYALVAYAAYEAGCLVRAGCFGPRSAIGLVPPGLSATVAPVGLFVAAAAVGLAIVARRVAPRYGGNAIAISVLGLAVIRAVASIWLPKIRSGPTRQHLESIVVAVAAGVVLSARWLYRSRASSRVLSAP